MNVLWAQKKVIASESQKCFSFSYFYWRIIEFFIQCVFHFSITAGFISMLGIGYQQPIRIDGSTLCYEFSGWFRTVSCHFIANSIDKLMTIVTTLFKWPEYLCDLANWTQGKICVTIETFAQNRKIMKSNQSSIIQVMIRRNMPMTLPWFDCTNQPIQVRDLLWTKRNFHFSYESYLFFFCTLSGFISPLCLPVDNYASTNENLEGKVGIIAGWGASVVGGFTIYLHSLIIQNTLLKFLSILSYWMTRWVVNESIVTVFKITHCQHKPMRFIVC